MTSITRPAAWRGDDFPSWLSPMIVKELRQGVQSGGFVWTFMGLQAVMCLVMSLGVSTVDLAARGARDGFEFFFWLAVTVAVLFVVPLRGLGAISGEQAGHKLDLVQLTQLSATKIVLGKWLAILAQALLLVTAILPYVVLRYFFGNVNVISSLAIIGWLSAGSMVIAAGAIALSTKPLWVRILAGAAVAMLALPMIGVVGGGGISYVLGYGVGTGVLPAVSGWGLVLALYTVALLEYSAAVIAPVAENHALRKRLLALTLGVVWVWCAAWASVEAAGWIMAVTLPLVLAFAIGAILEQPVHLRSQAATFARFGPLGRPMAWLLTPGWPSGLLFVLVMSAICLQAWFWLVARRPAVTSPDDALAFGTLLAAAVLFPLPLLVRLPRMLHRLLVYLIVQGLTFLPFTFASVMKPYSIQWHDWTPGWVSMLPLPMASIGSLVASNGNGMIAFYSIAASGIVAAITCLLVFAPWWREMRRAGRLLAETTAASKRRPTAAGAGAIG